MDRRADAAPPAGTPPDAYELLVQGVVDYAIYMLDPEGRVMSWNPGAERIKGYVASEILGHNFARFYTPEDVAAGRPEEALRTARAEGRFAAEGWRFRKDGTRFWAMVVIDALRRDGRLLGFAKITRDMTEQRAAERAAIESERRFRLLVEGVVDYAIYMLDPEGRVANWNAGARRIKGYDAAEIVGEHFSRFYTPEDVAADVPWTALAAARREGRYEMEGWRVRRDGTRFWANAVIDAIRDESGVLVGFAKITRDLTERREAAIQLERSREELFQAQKMEALGQLTGGLAHDFNNLLTGIIGSLELMRTRIAQGRTAELERYATAARSAADRAAALTHRLLAFARRQTLDPRATDANRLIAGMEDLVRRTVGPEIGLETDLAGDLWPVLCDPNQLEGAILNLCINARDAMPDGGRLVIRTANLPSGGAAARPDAVTIDIVDTGGGMPPDVVERAFDPFFTTKPIGQGTGLGLSMVYGFARQSGGQATIRSEAGAGTAVSLRLPRHLGDVLPEEAAPDPERIPRAASGETVLVVDDEATIRMLITEALRELGYAAAEVEDGAAGLAVLRSAPRIDLLITDVGLPGGMNGRQLAEAARGMRPGLKVLFITGYAEGAVGGEDRLPAGTHLLTKPFTMEALTGRLAGILRGG